MNHTQPVKYPSFAAHNMRDFAHVADFLIPRRRQAHIVVVILSILMLPGISATFSPIDI